MLLMICHPVGGRCWYVTVPQGGLSKCPVIHEVCWDCFQWASAVYSQSSIAPAHLETTPTPTSANGVALSVQHECRWRCRWHYLACEQIGDGVEIWFHASLPPTLFSLLSNQIHAIRESAPPLPPSFQPVFICLLWSSQALWWQGPEKRWACVISMSLCSDLQTPLE